jgi:hypothetical protein
VVSTAAFPNPQLAPRGASQPTRVPISIPPAAVFTVPTVPTVPADPFAAALADFAVPHCLSPSAESSVLPEARRQGAPMAGPAPEIAPWPNAPIGTSLGKDTNGLFKVLKAAQVRDHHQPSRRFRSMGVRGR